MLGSTTTPIARSKFNAYKGLGNSCPVCASTSGKCRWQNYELSAKNGKITPTIKTLCMTGAGGYGNPDYHYFSDTRDGQWGVYIPLIDWNEHRGENFQATPEQREQWVKDQQEKQKALLEAENKRRDESLPALERDIAARQILAQLSLNEIDRKDLIRRGFTQQQVKEIGFVSVEKFQRLKEPVNNRFPGVNIQGTKLNNGIAGILIPLYTVTGEIVAFQIRNREQSNNRYRWLSSTWEKGRDNGSAPCLPNGENPLTFAYPQLLGVNLTRNSIGLVREPKTLTLRHSIGLAEGTGAKPNLAAILTGQQIIGAAGGQWLSSPELLKDGLERWRAEYIDLYLDGEDIHKPQVIRRWVNLYHQLIEWGYKPRLMWSGSDIDELKDFSLLREIGLDELGANPSFDNGRLQLSIVKLLPPPVSLARKLYEQSKHFTPNQTQSNRFLKWDIPEIELENSVAGYPTGRVTRPVPSTLVGIKSALGTGKTEILKALGTTARERGLELIFIGYRNNLLRQTCDRLDDLYHVVDEDKVILASDYHKALCHHSAGLLDPTEMANKILILDECVSDLSDMLTSKLTAGRRKDGTDSRQVRLAHLEQLIINSHSVVALDAYLSDTELDFLRKLRQFDFVHKIENTYRNQMNVRMVDRKSILTRLLTPELKASIVSLSGREFLGDNQIIQDLGAEMEALGITDGNGRMRLVAGSARYLGLSAICRRYRTKRQGKEVTTRMYTFSGTPHPISDAIRASQVYPGNQTVQVKYIYECITKRLEQLAAHQQERVEAWRKPQIVIQSELDREIHIDNFASIDEIDLSQYRSGSAEFTVENLRSVAQTLLQIGQMEGAELESGLNEYLAVTNPEVARIAMTMLESKYPEVFDLLRQRFAIA